MTATRVAAIDCGTNSLRLLIADVDGEAAVVSDIERRMEIVRLGQGVDKTGELAPDALARTFAVLDEYAAQIRQHEVTAVRFVATSATRDASNREQFVDGVRERLGVEPEVITGLDEASLSFVGATSDLELEPAALPCLVVDIGGGSTEFVLGSPRQGIQSSASVPIGCVRMTERHFRHDPPLPSEVAAARDDIDAAIKHVALTVPLRQAHSMVGLAGSVTTVAAIALGLWEYDPQHIHHARITAADVHRVCEGLLYSTHEKRAANAVIHPGRVDVIGAGALVLSAVVAYSGLPELVVSEHDILDGIARSILTAK